MNANFRYNFAYLFKLRVFIRLSVLILNGKLPENLVKTLSSYKVVRFSRLFLAKGRQFRTASGSVVPRNLSPGIGRPLATTDCTQAAQAMRTLSLSCLLTNYPQPEACPLDSVAESRRQDLTKQIPRCRIPSARRRVWPVHRAQTRPPHVRKLSLNKVLTAPEHLYNLTLGKWNEVPPQSFSSR